jgi:YidC/Oxa1 family membrane protein insertase
MERGSITKWLLLGLAIFFLVQQGPRLFGFGKKTSEGQNLVNDRTAPTARVEPAACTIEGDRFKAELSSAGASLRHWQLVERRFDIDKHPMDLVTTSREARLPLRTDLRPQSAILAPTGETQERAQVSYDDLDWKLAESDGKRCVFTYDDASTSLRKTFAATGKPYEMTVVVEVKNLAAAPKKHRFAIEQDSFVAKKEVESGFMSRPTEKVSEVVVVGTKVERHSPSDFEPGELKKPEFSPEHWRRAPGSGEVAAVSSMYFSKLLVPTAGEGAPVAEALIEQWWNTARYPNKDDDPEFGYLYRARVSYPERELATGQSVTYKALAYGGPKERDLLAAVAPRATEVLNLGYFTTIAGYLISYLHFLYGLVKSWGVAIMLLTITVRMVLFPLSISQIKNSMAMRKLKPAMDEINERYKDDAAQRGLAIQELWRKNGVSNPVVGCLPLLLQMPVWWALYSALQTAVQLYHVPFLWFPDLTAYDHFYVIPFVLAGSSFLQQKLMPAQGDPQQQKMMLYMMPGIFFFMMLFLPAGLGVYMLTNSVLAIVQQLAVEKYLKTHEAPAAARIEVREKTSGGGEEPPPALGKGKSRGRG